MSLKIHHKITKIAKIPIKISIILAIKCFNIFFASLFLIDLTLINHRLSLSAGGTKSLLFISSSIKLKILVGNFININLKFFVDNRMINFAIIVSFAYCGNNIFFKNPLERIKLN